MQLHTLLVVLLCYHCEADFVKVVPEKSLTRFKRSSVITKPVMRYFYVESNIRYRYATTLVSTRIENSASVAQEVFFTATLPETAFISGFIIEVDGKVYRAYVKGKEEAQQMYDNAVQQGQTAAQVALTARDSNRFTVSINIEAHNEVVFNLTYDELLSRSHRRYRNIINLDPGQVVEDFTVIVRIVESIKIITLRVPAIKINEEQQIDHTNNGLANVNFPNETTAIVTFKPSPAQQRNFTENGIKGQFIVEYDVDRNANGGEILVNDGYFVHFFAPDHLRPLNKHVTFVLDVSGSMYGRPIEQLRQAMLLILDDLNDGDFFSIVLFSYTAQVWDPTISAAEMNQRMSLVGSYSNELAPVPTPATTAIVKVTSATISQAKSFVNTLTATDSTNIYDALMLALAISKLNPSAFYSDSKIFRKPEPIIIFLTDGMPNVRVSDTDVIVSDVTNANTKNSSIFSLALGTGAYFEFLKKLSLQNSGFARRIYEAADTAIQLTNFYAEISSPLLADVEFEYTPSQVVNGTVTICNFRRFFYGSEIVVAGKLSDDVDDFSGDVKGISINGTTTYSYDAIIIPYPPITIYPPVKRSPSNMERLWAYLTIQQLLDEDAALDYDHNDKNKTSPQKKRALELALQYSFVTSVTSLVVVKPNETRPVFAEDASLPGSSGGSVGSIGSIGSFGSAIRLALPHVYPVCLEKLEDISWLPANHIIRVPRGTGEVGYVAGTNETDTAFSSCNTPLNTPGNCRHLQYCVLNNIAGNQTAFESYFCDIGNSYVGVCCPNVILPDCPDVSVSLI